MICSDAHTQSHSCWCKLFEWIRIEWIRTGGIRVEDTYWWDMYWWDTFAIPADAHLLNGYVCNGHVLVGYVWNGYVWNGYVWDMYDVLDMYGILVVIGGIRITTFWMDTHCMDTYWWDTYVWDTFGMDMCGICAMCWICVGYVWWIRLKWICVGYVKCAGYVWDMCGVRYANNLLKNPATKRLSGKKNCRCQGGDRPVRDRVCYRSSALRGGIWTCWKLDGWGRTYCKLGEPAEQPVSNVWMYFAAQLHLGNSSCWAVGSGSARKGISKRCTPAGREEQECSKTRTQEEERDGSSWPLFYTLRKFFVFDAIKVWILSVIPVEIQIWIWAKFNLFSLSQTVPSPLASTLLLWFHLTVFGMESGHDERSLSVRKSFELSQISFFLLAQQPSWCVLIRVCPGLDLFLIAVWSFQFKTE